MTRVGAVPGQLAEDIAAAGISGLWVSQDNVDELPVFGGAYVLALRLDETINVSISNAVAGRLMRGWHVYAGSAQGSGGIRARIKRHFQQIKPIHWHIDQATIRSDKVTALAVPDGHECELVDRLLESDHFEVVVSGFGSTDCRRCDSHLLSAQLKELPAKIQKQGQES